MPTRPEHWVPLLISQTLPGMLKKAPTSLGSLFYPFWGEFIFFFFLNLSSFYGMDAMNLKNIWN